MAIEGDSMAQSIVSPLTPPACKSRTDTPEQLNPVSQHPAFAMFP
jgi:hypothetical protein